MNSSFSIPSRINPRICNPRFPRTAHCYVSLKSDSRWNKAFFSFPSPCYFFSLLFYCFSYFVGLNMQSVGGIFSLPPPTPNFILSIHHDCTLLKMMFRSPRHSPVCLELEVRDCCDCVIAAHIRDLPTKYSENIHLTRHKTAVTMRNFTSTLIYSNLTFFADCVSWFCWSSDETQTICMKCVTQCYWIWPPLWSSGQSS
jgi:hypothetical protein